MKVQNELIQLLNIRFPLIMAPMFLVSDQEMMEAGIRSGVMSVFPTLNYRVKGSLEDVIDNLHLALLQQQDSPGNFGVNLIVQKTNIFYKEHLAICVGRKVPFYITSLGNPRETIEKAHSYGAKVFCDVTNMKHAEKCAQEGCDGFIAVGYGAGGHAGSHPNYILIPSLKKQFPDIPVIAAGGIATGETMLSMLACGAQGVSVGTRFIASKEAKVSEAYKNSIVDSGMDDIVLSERISGTPCTIINTPYAQKIGLHQNWFEHWMSNNVRLKKYFKMLVQMKGMQKLEQAVKPGNYKNLWCAGESVEMIDDIISCEEIIKRMEEELDNAFQKLSNKFVS